jgi:hypothetical protein
MQLALRLSKGGGRVYVRDIIQETYKRLKDGSWSIDKVEK